MPADFTVFGDACPGEKKVLAVKVQCSGQESPEASQDASAMASAQTVVYRHSVTIPVGTAAQVVVPIPVGTAASAVTITEGGRSVWAAGAFVPGVDGVGSAGAAPGAIQLAVAQGSYVFELLA